MVNMLRLKRAFRCGGSMAAEGVVTERRSGSNHYCELCELDVRIEVLYSQGTLNADPHRASLDFHNQQFVVYCAFREWDQLVPDQALTTQLRVQVKVMLFLGQKLSRN